jgi:hypothetical protein
MNLYNPTGFAPVKISESGLTREFINPTYGYRLYFPAAWEVGDADNDGQQIVLSDVTGDYIEVRAVEKPREDTFADWLSVHGSDQYITDIQDKENRFEQQVKVRQDGLVAYVVDETHVYVLLYHPNETGPIQFRQVLELMYESFRRGTVIPTLPTQPVVPTPPTTTVEISTSTPSVPTSTTEVTSTTIDVISTTTDVGVNTDTDDFLLP